MKRRLTAALALCLCGALAVGCATTRQRGVWHEIERGQTLWRIARTYGVDLQELAELNDLPDPSKIRAGQKIFIPGVDRPLTVTPYQPESRRPTAARTTPHRSKSEDDAPTKVELHKGRLSWPVKGVLTSRYGIRGEQRHDGIDIGAPQGTSVLAAEAGEVVYAEETGGYGKLVIVQHAGEMVTVYAHCQVILVRKGQRVARGAEIAKVGTTGRVSGPHLHFEVRVDRRPRNPLFFLP